MSQAKEQLEILTANLVLLDVYFPGANGLEMLSYIRQHYRDTDVIMITAAKETDAIREAIRNGAFDYIIKPLVFNRFRKRSSALSGFSPGTESYKSKWSYQSERC